MRSHQGFTLIELMITVAILAIVAAYAMPSYTQFVNKQAARSEANAFATDLRYARSEASRANESVTICGTADGVTCSGSWGDKRIVFIDKTTQGVVDGADVVARITDAPRMGVSVSSSGFPSAGRLKFRATGQPEASIRLNFCAGSGSELRGTSVTLAVTGRPSISTFQCP